MNLTTTCKNVKKKSSLQLQEGQGEECKTYYLVGGRGVRTLFLPLRESHTYKESHSHGRPQDKS